jgi:hypothetical protein
MKIKYSNFIKLIKNVKIKDINYLVEKLNIEIVEG